LFCNGTAKQVFKRFKAEMYERILYFRKRAEETLEMLLNVWNQTVNYQVIYEMILGKKKPGVLDKMVVSASRRTRHHCLRVGGTLKKMYST
jgi:hypothetical protein